MRCLEAAACLRVASTCDCTASSDRKTVRETPVETKSGGAACANAAVLARTAKDANARIRRNMGTSFREYKHACLPVLGQDEVVMDPLDQPWPHVPLTRPAYNSRPRGYVQ